MALICAALIWGAPAAAGPDAADDPHDQGARPPDGPVDRQPLPPDKPEPTFNPSEKIRADSAVSFPVDI